MLKKWRVGLILLAVMAFGVFISACGENTTTGNGGSTPTAASGGSTPTASTGSTKPSGAFNCVQGSVTAAGSTALQPLVTAVAKDYEAKCSGANVVVNAGGSGQGLTQAEAGQIQIGNSDVFSKTGQEDLVDHQVAVVIFTIVLNSKVTGVTNLTTAQLQGIYSGKTTNWSQLGGPNLPIVVVTRPASSGTRQTFQNYVLGTVETVKGPSNLQTDSTGAVLTNVRQTAGALGYVTLGAAKGQTGITVVKIDNNDPTSDNVTNNTYKFWNIEHMYTKGAASGLTQAFIDYMGSDQAKQEAANLSFVPIASMESTAVAAHKK